MTRSLGDVYKAVRKAFSQSGTSSALTGTVLDVTGSTVSNADVTVTEVNTKAVRQGRTDVNGRFLLSQINPAVYQVQVTARGFAGQTSQPAAVAQL